MKQSTRITIIILLGIAWLFTAYKLYNHIYHNRLSDTEYASTLGVEVVLPEEYMLISPDDTLTGYYNKEQNTLYIAFNNKRKKSIPINSQNSKHYDTRNQRTDK